MIYSALSAVEQLDGLSLLRSGLRLLLLLLLLLLLFFLRNVMSDGTTRRRTQHRMMPGHVSRYSADCRTFDATLG